MKPYLGITGGITTDLEAETAKNALDSEATKLSPYKFMNGVLVNHDTINGRPSQKFPKRYPVISQTSHLFLNDSDVINTYHLNCPQAHLAENLRKLVQFGGPTLNGFQLNIAWPDPEILEKFREQNEGLIIILQIGGKAFAQVNDNPKLLTDVLKTNYVGVVDYILLDPSGGNSRQMNLNTQRKYLDRIYSTLLNQRLMIGMAGGLSPDNMTRVLPLINEFDLLSLDLEGSIRDKETDNLIPSEMPRAIAAYRKNIVYRDPEPIAV